MAGLAALSPGIAAQGRRRGSFSTWLPYVASVGFATQLCSIRQSFVSLYEESYLSFLLFCQ